MYNSEKVKKSLEGKSLYYIALKNWANFFDQIGMEWIYLPEFMGGDQSQAEFFLPEQGIYFKISTSKSEETMFNRYFFQKNCIPVVWGSAYGSFSIVEDGEEFKEEETWLSKCSSCGHYFFLNSYGSYVCRICGDYDGDHHLAESHTGEKSIFWLHK